MGTIKDGNVIEADDLLNNLLGKQFKNYIQAIWNADYIGWNSKLNYDKEGASGGSPEFTNLHWDNFNGNGIGVESAYGLFNDNTNKVYYTPDLSGVTEYVIIEATSLSSAWDNNNCKSLQIASGKWLVYCTTGTDAVHRAQIIKSLFYGTDGSDSLILDFTSVTAVKTSHGNDVGKRGHYMYGYTRGSSNQYITGTFADTVNNTNCSTWSYCYTNVTHYSDETGTDTSGDEVNNPTDCQFQGVDVNPNCKWEIPEGTTRNQPSNGAPNYDYIWEKVIVLCEGGLSWVATGGQTSITTEIDFYTDHSIPDMTLADTLANEGAEDGTLISNDTSVSATNGIAIWNSTIDATSTEAFYISADDGSNWESCTEKEIKRLSNSGSNLKIKWEVTRTDTSKKDTISEYGLLYNIGAGSG